MMMMIVIIRHNKVGLCTILHYSVCNKSGTETTDNWYSNIPMSVTEHEDITVAIMESRGDRGDREVLASRPDIIIKKRTEPAYLLL
jgi:hypothetical protein